MSTHPHSCLGQCDYSNFSEKNQTDLACESAQFLPYSMLLNPIKYKNFLVSMTKRKEREKSIEVKHISVDFS